MPGNFSGAKRVTASEGRILLPKDLRSWLRNTYELESEIDEDEMNFDKLLQTSCLKFVRIFAYMLLVVAVVSSGVLGAAQTRSFQRREILIDYIPVYSHPRLVRVAFVDVDQTLRTTISGKPVPRDPTDQVLLPFVAENIAFLRSIGYLVAAVSNQASIALGSKGHEEVTASFWELQRLLKNANPMAQFDYFDYAEDYDENRKPGIQMAARLFDKIREHRLTPILIASIMIGDSGYARAKGQQPADIRPDGTPGTDPSNADRLFAQNFGQRPFLEAKMFFGWKYLGFDRFTRAEEVQVFAARLNNLVESSGKLSHKFWREALPLFSALFAFPEPVARTRLLKEYSYTVENPLYAIRQLTMLVHPDRRQLSGASALPDDVLARLDEFEYLLQQRLMELRSEAYHSSQKADQSWLKPRLPLRISKTTTCLKLWPSLWGS